MEKTSEINTPEGRCAAEIITSLQRARKNLRIYPENNPIYMRTVEETYRKTMEFFEFGDSLELRIQRNEFMFGDEEVYSGTGQEENFALFFFRDGLRSLTFKSGLEQEELLNFLNVVAVDLDREEVEEDMVTLLWEKDFLNIKYKVDDSMLVEDENFQKEAEEKVKETPTDEGVMQQAQEAPPEEEETVPITPMPISDEDLKQIARDIEDYGKGNLDKLTDIVFDMLYASGGIEEFKDVVRIIQNSVEYSASNNDLRGAMKIFQRVKDVIRKTKSENVGKTLNEVLRLAGSDSLMKIIGERLDAKDGIEDEDFKEYVGMLSANAIPRMIALMGDLQTIQGRKTAIKALTFIGKRDIGALAKGLKDQRWYVVRNIVLVLRETKDKNALAHIVRALAHEEPRVRREAIKGISDLRGLKYIDRIAQLLYDPDHGVSIAAALALGRLRNKVGMDALQARITDKNLLEENSPLLKKYFEALSFFKYEDVIGFLEDILKKNPFFGRAAYNELKASAIYCLGLLGNPGAMGLLEELAGSKVKQIADSSTMAIKRIQRAKKG
ncbi:MAG: HEAT repeat domain-containing protein [Thermodesulfovibrionales bacterium]|nr:HEAT repeat domain-containing protein [Thermodesulfovibrionales bacterium]